jgi:hypothetical protein
MWHNPVQCEPLENHKTVSPRFNFPDQFASRPIHQ